MKISKLNYLISLSILLLFLYNQQADCQRLAISHGPYLLEPGEDCITINWITNKDCLSWVEFCGDDNFRTFPVWGGYPKSVTNSTNGLVDANSKRHSIRLTNLEPGKKYRYRIVSKEIILFNAYEVIYGDSSVGEIHEFETLDVDKKSFSFSVVTDVHGRSAVLDTLLQVNPIDSSDMMFYTGDMLNWIGSEEEIFNGFLDVSVDRFAKRIPIIFTRGNHDGRGKYARQLFSYFPHSSGKYYYAFSHGDVRFVIMDSGEDKPDTHPVYAGLIDSDNYRSEQAEWLKNEIQNEEFKSAKYRIVLIHIPLFSGGKGHGGNDCTQKWGPILNNADIDILICGHTHRYARINEKEGMNSFPILVVGAGQILQTNITSEKLNFSIKDTNGKKVDEFDIMPGSNK